MTNKEWLIITMITFLTILAWVVFDILHTRSQVVIPPQVQQLSQPISPQFDLKGLQ